jgi:glyoxylase-like metal-dependent hydrolase (beta-lactamase superfamily II)
VTRTTLHAIRGIVPPAKLLLVHLVASDDEWLWIDTGISSTPRDDLLPYLDAAGLRPPERQAALITHPDVDHFGGLTGLIDSFPALEAMAHPADARLIRDRSALMAERYLMHRASGICPDEARQQQLNERGGPAPEVAREVTAGAVLHGGLQVLHLPGHSAGHLGAWDAEHGRAIIGDAVLDWGVRDVDGHLMSPPPYYDVDAYLATIDQLERLAPDELHTSHYPVLRGEQVTAFLNRSRVCVEAIEGAVRAALERARAGATLRELCTSVARSLARWPIGTELQLADPISAHLARAGRDGSVRRTSVEGAVRYTTADGGGT